MQMVIELIRKLVILVLLMEVVLQLQSGKSYEPYIKMLIGIMVVYSLVSGLFQTWSSLEIDPLTPMTDFKWIESWYEGIEKEATELGKTQKNCEEKIDEAQVQAIEPVQIEIAPVEEIRVQEVQR